MLRTLFTVGIVALLGLVALKLVFGLLGPLVALLFWLVGLAIKVLLLPKDTNALGTIFGGVILSHIDLASAVEARKTASHRYVTKAMNAVEVAPCWTMMVAFPNATQPNLHIGPQWNAARSIHHRIAWLARESSKPGRGKVERWTVQASAAWSAEHITDTESRVKAKLFDGHFALVRPTRDADYP